MLKTLEDTSFMFQERFTTIEDQTRCTQASVSTGVAIQSGHGTPIIQISTPRTTEQASNSLNTISSCPIDFYVNHVSMSIPGDGQGPSTYDNSGEAFGSWIEGPGASLLPVMVLTLHQYV